VLGPGDGGADAQPDAATQARTCLAGVQAQWGDGLAQFNVTNAAKDLKAAIDAVKRPTDKVFVYGVSYGTYWAHRYLQIFPAHAASGGVILDSIVPPEGEYVSMFDRHGDPVGQRLAEACKSDATCSAAFGADPWTRVKSIVASIGQGHCPELGATRENRTALFAFLEVWGANVYPFAALHRFERCTPEDVVALRALFAKTSAIGPPPGLFSPMLNQNIAFSELWETPAPSDATMRQRFDDAVFAAGAGLGPFPSIWPTYPHDEYWGKYAQTSVPVLMLNGTYDVQTPIETASRMKDHLNGPHQTFVTIPTADHATINQSPTKDLTGAPGPPCGFSIIMSFLDDPNGTPDTSCLSQLTKLSFDGDPNMNQFFWGAPTIWTGLPQAKPTTWPEWLPKPVSPHRFLVP